MFTSPSLRVRCNLLFVYVGLGSCDRLCRAGILVPFGLVSRSFSPCGGAPMFSWYPGLTPLAGLLSFLDVTLITTCQIPLFVVDINYVGQPPFNLQAESPRFFSRFFLLLWAVGTLRFSCFSFYTICFHANSLEVAVTAKTVASAHNVILA